jgi:hypothetical protein
LYNTIGKILGIEYIYENETINAPSNYINQGGVLAKDVAKIPNDLLLKMQNALATADLDLLIELIKSMRTDHAELTSHLLNLASEYNYDQLQKILYKKQI